MVKTLDYLNIFILIGILAISPWYYGSVGLRAQYFIHIACLAMLLIWMVKTNILTKKFPYCSIYTPLFLFFIIALLSVSFSIYRYASILGILNLFSYVIIFFIATQILNNEQRINLFIWFIILIGLFYAGYGISQYYGYLAKDFWTQSNSLASRFVNSGSFGAFINIVIFLALAKSFATKKLLAKIICFSFLFLLTISLILSKSRISWLTFVFTLTLFLIISIKKVKLTYKRGFIFIVIFGIIIGYVIFQYKSLIWGRLYVLVGTQFHSLHQRMDVWKGTIRIILSHPFGSGLGTFSHIYPAYRIHSDRFVVDYAHSDFLQIASELGIIGLAAFVWFIIRSFKQAFKTLFSLPAYKFFTLLGLICAVLVFVLQSLFDFSMHIPANAILFFVTIALLISYISGDRVKTGLLNKNVKISLIILIIISSSLFTYTYISKKYSHLAGSDYAKIHWQNALYNYNKAIKFMPLDANNYAKKASMYALKATLSFKSQEKKEHRKIAINNFLKAISLNSYQSDYYLNLAWAYEQDARHREAIYAFHKAIETNPTNGASYYPYADYCLEHNLLNEALRTYRKALSLFTEENYFIKRYGINIHSLLEKIYGYTKEYNQIKLIFPEDNLNARLEFTRFLEIKNRTSEAYEEYKDILTRFPNNETAKKALERLKGAFETQMGTD